uniref:Methyltransferase domain-containing protein n=1 Tax=Tetradesmus obliquus TaxID=3088 RepID=A0A383VST6_TETOB|eukprot:jgi/Sobl393_1/14917/SZX68577.1
MQLARVPAAAPGSTSALTAEQATGLPKQRLLYDGVVFDMDGTLTQAHIDFADMRARTGIPVGDLFVAMESWEEPERIKQSMDVILEIEAEAAKSVQGKDGLMELLQMLKQSDVKVALVTRNTTSRCPAWRAAELSADSNSVTACTWHISSRSQLQQQMVDTDSRMRVAAFFQLIGEEWRGLFSEVRTREFKYVKPDKRLLLDVAEAWQLHPGRLLMVGDSFEDVEVGNAAGTATCLIAGGGNEAPGSNIGPPAGAIPTFSVSSLVELRQFLQDTAPSSSGVQGLDFSSSSSSSSSSSIDNSSLGLLGWSLRSSSESESDDDESAAAMSWLDPTAPGNPAAGLDFVDYLVDAGALCTASTSFPRMGAAAGGLQACALGGGHRVLHVGCGDGALTKMLASKGLQVIGVDADVTACIKRGLKCVAFDGAPLAAGSMATVAASLKEPADAVLIYTAAAAAAAAGQGYSSAECLSAAALQEYRGVLKPSSGCVCAEVPLSSGSSAEEVQAQLQAAGYAVDRCEVLPAAGGQQRLRVVGRPQ